MHIGLRRSAHLLHEAPDPTPGLRLYRRQRKQRQSERQAASRVWCHGREGAAQHLGQMFDVVFSAVFTRRLGTVPTRILGDIFKQAWSQIVPRHCPLSPELRQHLQTEISARLCSFVARGV